jgi:hypothetical protein
VPQEKAYNKTFWSMNETSLSTVQETEGTERVFAVLLKRPCFYQFTYSEKCLECCPFLSVPPYFITLTIRRLALEENMTSLKVRCGRINQVTFLSQDIHSSLNTQI